jgi:hypothetical protein
LNPGTTKSANPKWLFESAEAFNKGADTLKEVRRTTIILSKEGRDNWKLTVSALVLESLAAELYLKALLAEEFGVAPLTHDLFDLFRQLSRQTKEKLKKRHSELVVKDPELSWRLRRPGFDLSLEALLELNKDSFEQYRYLHEGNAKSPFFLNVLMQCIRKYILARHPDWGK